MTKTKAPSIERIDSSKGYEMNNIEIITHSENSRRGAKNQKAGSSGYKGVSSRPNGRFYVTHSSGSHGGFSCKHEAARVWNTVSRMFNGPNAFMNTVTNA